MSNKVMIRKEISVPSDFKAPGGSGRHQYFEFRDEFEGEIEFCRWNTGDLIIQYLGYSDGFKINLQKDTVTFNKAMRLIELKDKRGMQTLMAEIIGVPEICEVFYQRGLKHGRQSLQDDLKELLNLD